MYGLSDQYNKIVGNNNIDLTTNFFIYTKSNSNVIFPWKRVYKLSFIVNLHNLEEVTTNHYNVSHIEPRIVKSRIASVIPVKEYSTKLACERTVEYFNRMSYAYDNLKMFYIYKVYGLYSTVSGEDVYGIYARYAVVTQK